MSTVQIALGVAAGSALSPLAGLLVRLLGLLVLAALVMTWLG